MVLGHEACGAVDAVQGQSGDLLTNAIKRNVTLNVDQLKNAAPTWVRLLPTTKSAWWGVFTS